MIRFFVLLFCLSGMVFAVEPCRIDVVDAEDGWAVPLVELRTVHGVRFVSDNAGVIAFDLPELMGVETYFFVSGHGYEVTKDGFGYRGVKLVPTAGGQLTVTVDRRNLAKRLGRLTGAGIFAESQKLGMEMDWKDSGVLGCDSVQMAVHRGKLFWAWGDTNLPGYPLGIFDTSSATTELKPLVKFEPPLKVAFDYFRDEKGKPRGVADMPGDGPTWLIGYVSLPDKAGKSRLCAHYVKIKPPLEVYEAGLCVWDDGTAKFERLKELPHDALGSQPTGHPTVHEGWVYFGDPFPHLKCAATFEAWSDPASWVKLDAQKMVIPKGGGDEIEAHRGSIMWSAYRKKWVSVFTRKGGEASFLGEIWYAEADALAGPWKDAVKVLTHDNYSFYNPRLHPEFAEAESPFLVFEGTYTQTFADRPVATARWDYNQVMYRLDFEELE
jgi:hypothetical protein